MPKKKNPHIEIRAGSSDWVHVLIDGELAYEGHPDLDNVVAVLEKAGVNLTWRYGQFRDDPGRKRCAIWSEIL